MAKVCVFCGCTPLTKEHVLPRWLKAALDPTVRQHRYIRLSVDAVRHHEAPPLNEQVKSVCSNCNSGWMNQLEEDVRRFLPNLIRGNPCTLGAEAQRALAAWSLKTMLTFQHTHPADVRGVIPASDFASFHETREPTRSMLGRLGFMNYPPDDSVPLVDTLCQGYSADGVRRTGWITTLKIGCMVVQIIRAPDVAEGKRLAPFDPLPSLRPIWPTDEPIEWPLPAAIPYELMSALAHPDDLDLTIMSG
ncbi:hypothetical protein [Streptomyces scabiei]|uniref:HNH endonuclease 5 domain-containing protein n=1 Tax=Streptomyces scabiei TaxID=1930 RepID=A0A117ED57_STRSC|nr:hypothetical protein [Streptomyces scabiei]GAQ61432.1 hypothetical protein SsS58_01781 [Streptomyces scabiei]